MSKIKKTDHFYLIDGSGYIFRAYYALPPLTRKSDGLPTGAVSGFCSMLFKLLEDSKSKENLQKPSHFAVIFDSARKTFRNEIYKDYKANRAEAPDDLAPQFDYIRKSVLAFNLPSVELTNYEADDLIATYTNMILKVGAKVTIVSSDKDLMQLYKKGVRIYDPMKNKFINDEDVQKKFGVTADKVIDVQALAGDSSDNVPGVPGIGVKTAAELINKYGDLETLLKSASEIKQNVWSYSWITVQSVKQPKISSVVLKAFVVGEMEGISEKLPFDELDEYLPRFPLDLRVKYFSSTKGKLSFPEGFTPKQVKFMLHYAQKPSEIYETNFEWSYGV